MPTRRVTVRRPVRRSVRRSRRKPLSTGGRLLALDTSSVCVGWALFEGATLVAYGKHQQRGTEHDERLVNFEDWLRALLKEHRPEVVVVEAPYAGRRRFTYGVLMLYLAVVLMVHMRHFGCPMPSAQRVAAHQVKRLCGVQRAKQGGAFEKKGSAHETNKRLMINRINELYGLDLRFKAGDKTKRVSDDDVADAIAVGHAWIVRYVDGDLI
jgi:Holliday junction resolvasome RuvABC endonuclease subunit